MTNYAYCDMNNVVVGLSTVQRTLQEAKAINSAIDYIISSAPDGLGILYPTTMTGIEGNGYYHTHDHGDGTDIRHYVSAVDPGQLVLRKNARHLEIEEKTFELVYAAQFEFPPGSGGMFMTTQRNQRNWLSLFTVRNEVWMTWPQDVSRVDHSRYSILDATILGNFVATGFGAIMAVVAAGKSIHDSVNAATTPEAVAAVVDPR